MSPIRIVFCVAAALGAASAAARAGAGSPPHAASCDNGLCLRVTVAQDNGDPAQCGASASIEAVAGDLLNYCYTVTNNGSTTLNWHSLRDAVHGTLFEYQRHPLAPGETWRYNRVLAAGGETTVGTTWTATDALPNYAAGADAYAFIDVTASGTRLNLPNDGGAPMTLPFPFKVYDVTSQDICIQNDGVVILGFPSEYADRCQSSISNLWNNVALPFTLPFPGKFPLLMPMWSDSGGVYGNVYAGAVGTAPNRKYVVEWYQVESGYQMPGTGEATYEVVFDEASGHLSFQYLDVTFSDPAKPYLDYGGFATIGLAYDGTLYDQYSFDSPVLHDQSAIGWTPLPVARATTTADVAIASPARAATVAAAPAALSASLAGGATATATLAIGNEGGSDLVWYVRGGTGQPAAAANASAATRPASGAAAYGFSYLDDGSNAYSLVATPDLAAPGSGQVVANAPRNVSFSGGTFVNDDFSREYVLTSSNAINGSPDWMMYTFGTADGALNRVGTLSLYDYDTPTYGLTWKALAWDATTATLYGIAFTNDFTLYPYSMLYTIDPATAATHLIGYLPHGVFVQTLAADADGTLYGIDANEGTHGKLVTIDKTTAAPTPIGPLGVEFRAGMYSAALTFDGASGTLYFSAAGQLYALDVGSGAATALGPLFLGQGTDAFAIAAPGPCKAGAAPWLSLAPASGSVAPGAQASLVATFDASGLAAGTYTTNLCVHGNDPQHRVIAVPVTLTVAGAVADRIFSDGFDG